MGLYSPNFMGLSMCIIISDFLIKDDVAILILTPENLVTEMRQIILSSKTIKQFLNLSCFVGKYIIKKKCPLELSYNTRTLLQY